MRPDNEVHEVFRLWENGLAKAEIARRVKISRATVRDWLGHGEEGVLSRPMRAAKAGCGDQCDATTTVDEDAYAYLLGQYLGDGCISRVRSAWRLRIACCDAYPDIMAEVVEAIGDVKPGASVGLTHLTGCTEVFSTWVHWPCLFPQHGPGRKHERRIVLEPWQEAIALERFPDRFVRGLIHSDGCRCINHVRGANGMPYSYPRYMFSNRSDDIRRLFTAVCDRLGIEWRRMNRWNISVARRDSVAQLDRIVGPKS